MWTIRLHWYKSDPSPATAPCGSEIEAREYAAHRSAQVQGKCEVLYDGEVIGTYVAGYFSA